MIKISSAKVRKLKQVTCNVTVVYSYSNKIINISVSCLLFQNNKIVLNDVVENISEISEVKGYIVSYYDNDLKAFIYCGVYPFDKKIVVDADLKEKLIPIQIKLRKIIHKDQLLKTELLEEENENADDIHSKIFINEKSKRAKERKIGDIIKKVYMWRKLYFGYRDEDGNEIKLSLDDAAEKIGISKKSLDDYLIQLRIGKKFGFNFNEHRNDKVGVLRAFVKKNKPFCESNEYSNLIK